MPHGIKQERVDWSGSWVWWLQLPFWGFDEGLVHSGLFSWLVSLGFLNHGNWFWVGSRNFDDLGCFALRFVGDFPLVVGSVAGTDFASSDSKIKEGSSGSSEE